MDVDQYDGCTGIAFMQYSSSVLFATTQVDRGYRL